MCCKVFINSLRLAELEEVFPPLCASDVPYRFFLCSIDRASLYNLVNETNLVHNFFSVYFVNILYNLYMFRASPGPSSGGRTVFYVTLGTCVLYS